MKYQVVVWAAEHDCNDFRCLEPALTEYLTGGRAARDMETRQAAVYLMLEGKTVLGYYTLSAASIDRGGFSARLKRALPYPEVPVTLLGRVAVHERLRGQGTGQALILHALRRAEEHSRTVGSYAVVLDAKNEKVAAMYERLGFVRFRAFPLRLFLPMATVAQLPD